ncbi:L,D-transpeptidase family protein [Pseudomonas vancouverensis]|uniref:L,D-transpeptidase family protein n=1 Tax=Pseudomonas vancouverensis TaxID=95300 RepID=UPI003D04CFEE
MNTLIKSLCLLLFPLTAMAQGLDGSDQLIVVTSKDWDDIHAIAQRYERHGKTFDKFEAPFAVVLGKNGMGWGKGLLDPGQPQGPVKQEGDGKAPAGVFSLGTAFGYDHSADTRLPYLPLTAAIECVDDSQSTHYNQLLDGTSVAKDWNSSEHMRRTDELYRQGIFIKHNTPATAAAGSCIFFHVWRGPSAPTRGCTAMEPADIARLLQWLDPKKSPLLVQLPEAQYEQLRERWSLPQR